MWEIDLGEGLRVRLRVEGQVGGYLSLSLNSDYVWILLFIIFNTVFNRFNFCWISLLVDFVDKENFLVILTIKTSVLLFLFFFLSSMYNHSSLYCHLRSSDSVVLL